MVLRHTSVARKDAHDGETGKKKLNALQMYAGVVERCGRVAGSGFRGKLAGADRQPSDVCGFGVHQKCAIVTRGRVVFSEVNEVVTLFIGDMKSELGECQSTLSSLSVISEGRRVVSENSGKKSRKASG